MSLKIHDRFLEHVKTIAAADALGGPYALSRVAAVWLEAACYASRRLTDGFVPTQALVDSRADDDALAVARALASANLMVEIDGGFRFHDWNDYNPKKAAR